MTLARHSLVLAAAGLALLVAPAWAGESNDAARAAFDNVLTARVAYQAAAKQAKADTSLRPEMAKLRTAYTEANNAFRDAFIAANWNAFDVEKDAPMLEQGLAVGGRHLIDSDPDRAIAAFDMILEKLPKSSSVRMARTFMSYAYIEKGDFSGAVDRIATMSAGLDGPELANLLITQGDLQAAIGSIDSARATYEKAAAAVAGELSSDRDPRGRPQRYAAMRLALVGATAPEISSETWLGAAPQELSALKGKVVVVDFWATWCPPCRDVMPALNAMSRKHKAAGLEVLGVTRFYTSGFMPNSAADVHKGERVAEMTEETFVPHLEEFKKRLDIDYPFVVGEKGHFESYQISGIPTLAVIGRDGKIAMVKVGSGGEKLLEAAVERLLKADSAPKASD